MRMRSTLHLRIQSINVTVTQKNTGPKKRPVLLVKCFTTNSRRLEPISRILVVHNAIFICVQTGKHHFAGRMELIE